MRALARVSTRPSKNWRGAQRPRGVKHAGPFSLPVRAWIPLLSGSPLAARAELQLGEVAGHRGGARDLRETPVRCTRRPASATQPITSRRRA